MSLRRVHSWVWLLLPLLVARALMPVGFMAQVHEGRLQIVFCSAGYAQHVADVDSDAEKQSQDGHSNSHDGFSCPFAQVAGAPLLSFNDSKLVELIPEKKIAQSAESPYYAAGPPRVDLARGPPSLR